MTRLRSLAVLVTMAVTATLVAMLASPSQAAVLPGVAPCVDQLADAPKHRRHLDHTPVSSAEVGHVDTSPKARKKSSARTPGIVYIPVHFKVIEGTHRSEKWYRGDYPLRLTIRQLNIGYSAQQNTGAATTRYRFYLRAIKRVTNDKWYHATLFNYWDQQAKRALHSGAQRTLNLYINGGGGRGHTGEILGWARFPWQVAADPELDGVTISHHSMQGGSARHYNRGDTAIHEVGHWLGLYHTFQNGCDRFGDLVDDTPREGQPSFTCPKGRDTCAAAGYDPVTNFMDYSYDRCMNQFTPGQVDRMDAAWAQWRA